MRDFNLGNSRCKAPISASLGMILSNIVLSSLKFLSPIQEPPCQLLFFIAFHRFFKELDFKELENPSIFIDGHPSLNINGFPSMDINGFLDFHQ